MAVTPQTNTTFEDIAGVLADKDDFVICGHVGPDGDCLGSQLALAHALRFIGKRVTCVLVKDDPLPVSLGFMPGAQEMIPASQFTGDCKVFVGVDVPSRERIGEDACSILDRSELSVTIDHHAAPERMCDYAYVDPDSASASILVWQVVKALCEDPPIESAYCAFTGLVTDTGGFRFQNSDTRAFSVAAELVDFGVNAADVCTHVFQNRSMISLKLESVAIERMELIAEGQAALSWITADDFEKFNAQKSDTEELVNALRSVTGVRVACVLRDQDGVVRGSLRAKDTTDVSELARKLGGGGHRAAAGITLRMPMDDAVELMRQELHDLVLSELS